MANLSRSTWKSCGRKTRPSAKSKTIPFYIGGRTISNERLSSHPGATNSNFASQKATDIAVIPKGLQAIDK
jgi:hypothetical protein